MNISGSRITSNRFFAVSHQPLVGTHTAGNAGENILLSSLSTVNTVWLGETVIVGHSGETVVTVGHSEETVSIGHQGE